MFCFQCPTECEANVKNLKERAEMISALSVVPKEKSADAEAEFLAERNERRVVRAAQVGHQTAAAADHLEHTAAGSFVLLVGAKVFGQILNALGQHRDLDFGRAGIAFVFAVFFGESRLFIFC